MVIKSSLRITTLAIIDTKLMNSRYFFGNALWRSATQRAASNSSAATLTVNAVTQLLKRQSSESELREHKFYRRQ